MRFSRIVGVVLALLAVPCAAAPSQAAGIVIFSSEGTELDPLTGFRPIALRPPETRKVSVLLTSDAGPVFVTPTVNCCVDVLTGAPVAPLGLGVAFERNSQGVGFADARVLLRPGVPVHATLAVQATPAALTVPQRFFTATISISHPSLGSSSQTIFISVLGPTPVDTTTTPCAAFVNGTLAPGAPGTADVLPVAGLVDSLFRAKAAEPWRTRFAAAALTADERNGWDLVFAPLDPVPSVPLRPDEAIIVFENTTNRAKELWTLNGASCFVPPPLAVSLQPGERASIRIARSGTTTLFLRRQICRRQFIFCWEWGWEPVAVFSQPAFWSLVGGRVTTISWSGSL